MASPSRPPLPLRRQSSTRSLRHDNDDLAQSLNQLSISTSPGRASASWRLSEPTTPFRSTGRRPSQSPNPNARQPSRSPSSHGREPGSTTPALLRKASMNSLRSANGVGPGQTPTRRASATHNLASPTAAKSPLHTTPSIPEKALPTASSIASDFFKAELEAHHGQTATRQTQTVVILNDAVYGHRFSRPRTTRAALSTIVERPERIKAAVLGISTAYVRLGERHCDGAYPIHPNLRIDDLPSIPFRIHKTERRLSLLSPAVVNVHGTKWMEELKTMCEAAESKLAMGGKELQRPDMYRGTNKPLEKFHEGDLYLCAESLNAMEGALGAVCEAVDTVFGTGPQRAFVGVRPPGHHCSASYPSGFCWVNNVHVGIMHAALNHGLTHAAIIDFDLHHGDGSQSISWQHNTRGTASARNAAAWKKSSIGYFSLHDINSYPCEMGDEEKVKNASICIDNAHGQTVWNVHLQSWKTEEDFWRLYETKYVALLDKVRTYLKNQAERLETSNLPPKAAIFFSAGFDASEWESAGMQRHQVNVPTEFYARIAQDVVKIAAEEGLYVDGRIISVLEGGYSDRALVSGIFSHLSGLVGDQANNQSRRDVGSLAAEMGQKIGVAQGHEDADEMKPSLDSVHAYDPTWWASQRLEELEAVVADLDGPRKKPQSNKLPTYFSPTQASTGRVSDPIKMRRSLSNLGASMARPPTPPPPEVPWTVAVHELSKLIIPLQRQTDSCKPEDLNAEASNVRRDRQSLLLGIEPAPTAQPSSRPTSRMSLRERKSKPAAVETSVGKASKGRRKTVGGPVLSAEKVSNECPRQCVKPVLILTSQATVRGIPSTGGEPVRRASRRLSELPTSLGSSETSLASSSTETNHALPSQSVDPGSPSAKAPAEGSLPVKKTRNPTAPRKQAASKVLRVPKNVAATGSKPATTAAGMVRSSARAGPSQSTSDGLDQITSGMKKIRINLITKSQKEARERACNESKQAASAPPIPEEPESHPTPAVASAETRDISPTQIESHVSTPPATISSGFATPLQEQSPFDTLPTLSPVIAVQSNQDVFVPYSPEGPPHVAVPQQQPLKWIPPNAPIPSAQAPAATPSPVKNQNNLFRYTSGITFAPAHEAENKKPGTDVSETRQD